MSYRIALPTAHEAARRGIAALLSLAALGGAAGTAGAQDSATPARRSLTGVVGIGVVALPKYAGSDEHRVLPLPVAQLEYKGHLYLGESQTGMSPGLGAFLVRTPTLTWDIGVSGAESRPESRGDALAGMGKRSGAGFATTGVASRLGFVQATAGVAVGLEKDAGSYGSVGLGTALPLARRWLAGVATGATFADARHMAFDFGVTHEQSAARHALLAAGSRGCRGSTSVSTGPARA